MKSRVLGLWLAILFVFAGLMLLREVRRRTSGTVEIAHGATGGETGSIDKEQLDPLSKFVLTNQHGQSFDSNSMKGKIWVASFFFAGCPQVCRQQNTVVAQLQTEYANRGLELVSITCDPDQDTPAALARYASVFGANHDVWHFLTGDFQLIKRIGNSLFQVMLEKETHSDRLMLVDRNGELLGKFRATRGEEFVKLKQKLDEILSQPTESKASTSETFDQPVSYDVDPAKSNSSEENRE